MCLARIDQAHSRHRLIGAPGLALDDEAGRSRSDFGRLGSGGGGADAVFGGRPRHDPREPGTRCLRLEGLLGRRWPGRQVDEAPESS